MAAEAAVEREAMLAQEALRRTWPQARSGHSFTAVPAMRPGATLMFGGQASAPVGGGQGDFPVQGPLLSELWLFDCSRCDKAAPQAGKRQGSWKQMHITDQHAERPGEGVPAARVYHAAAAPLADDGGGALIIFGGLGISSELHEIVRDTRVSSLTPRASSQVQVQAYPVGSEGGYHTQAHDLLSDVWRLDLGGPSWERLESRVWDTGVQPAKAYGASVAACSALHACGASMPLHLFGGMRRLPLFDGSGGASGGGTGAGGKASTTTSLRPSAELWAFDPRGGGQWERVLPQGEAAAWPAERAFHTALVLADTMLVYGGVREDGGTLS